MNTRLKKGFTLIEVVIALAVFAFLIGGLLGFLPWSVEGVSKVREQDTTYGLVDGIQIELERMGVSLVGEVLIGLRVCIVPLIRRESGTKLNLFWLLKVGGEWLTGGEEASLAEMNSDQLEEGANQDLLTKAWSCLF